MPHDDSDPALLAFGGEARRLEPRVVSVTTRTKDYKTVLIIETQGLTTTEVRALSETLKTYRRRHDLAAEFLIVNTAGGDLVKGPGIPPGWPP